MARMNGDWVARLGGGQSWTDVLVERREEAREARAALEKAAREARQWWAPMELAKITALALDPPSEWELGPEPEMAR